MPQQPNSSFENNLPIGPGIAVWVHLNTARDFQNNGKFFFDFCIIVTPQVAQEINRQARELSQRAVREGTMTASVLQNTAFRFPAKEINEVNYPKAPQIVEMFKGNWIVAAKRKQDKGPPPVIPGPNAALLVPNEVTVGNHVVISGDLMTYEANTTNLGVSVRINAVYKLQEGTPFADGGADATLSDEVVAAAMSAAMPVVPPQFQQGTPVQVQPQPPMQVQPVQPQPPVQVQPQPPMQVQPVQPQQQPQQSTGVPPAFDTDIPF